MDNRTNRFLLIFIALALMVLPLRIMSAPSMEMADSESGCPHMTTDGTTGSASTGVQMDCCGGDEHGSTCEQSCSDCIHAGSLLINNALPSSSSLYTSRPAIPVIDFWRDHSTAPPLRPPADLHS